MTKVLFTIKYEIKPDNQDEFYSTIKEMKNLLNMEGLEDYSTYKIKGKKNQFQEVYSFSSMEAFEAFDDDNNERLNILVSKLNDLTVDHSTTYTTMEEILGK